MITLEMAIEKIQQFTPEQQHQIIEFVEFLESKSTRASHTPTSPSFAVAAQEFIGCLESELEDLSFNPQYLEGFGQS